MNKEIMTNQQIIHSLISFIGRLPSLFWVFATLMLVGSSLYVNGRATERGWRIVFGLALMVPSTLLATWIFMKIP